MFNQQLEDIIGKAFEEAPLAGHAEVTPEHLLILLMDNEKVHRLLTVFEVDYAGLRDKLQVFVKNLPTIHPNKKIEPQPSQDLKGVLQGVGLQRAGRKEIRPVDVVVEMIYFSCVKYWHDCVSFLFLNS
jgi:ATP-dependent Clp protease ATP-binding subunit ClpA